MNCIDAQKRLLESADTSEAPPPELDEHLAACPECTEFRAAFRPLVTENGPAPSADLDNRILALAAERQPRSTTSRAPAPIWPFPRRTTIRWAAAAGLALLAAVTLFALLRPATSPPAVAQAPASGDPENPDVSNTTSPGAPLFADSFHDVDTALLLAEARFDLLGTTPTSNADAGDEETVTERTDADEALLNLETELIYTEQSI